MYTNDTVPGSLILYFINITYLYCDLFQFMPIYGKVIFQLKGGKKVHVR